MKRKLHSVGDTHNNPTPQSISRCFAGVDAYKVSNQQKQKQRKQGIFLDGIQYGEIDLDSFLEVPLLFR